MTERTKIRSLALAIGAGLAMAVSLAAVAVAGVVVYSNDLSTKHLGKELKHAEGKGKNCGRHVKNGSLLIQVTGKDTCGYLLPVEGDRSQPDHAVSARLKLSKDTPKALRKKTFLGLAVRTGDGTGYTFRILPKRHEFKLRRLPKGNGFPVSGKDHAIKATNKWNYVRLQAFGNRIAAVVNKTKVADVKDTTANKVKGREAEVFAGANKTNNVGASVRIDDVKLSVPVP